MKVDGVFTLRLCFDRLSMRIDRVFTLRLCFDRLSMKIDRVFTLRLCFDRLSMRIDRVFILSLSKGIMQTILAGVLTREKRIPRCKKERNIAK
jgi:hypothetical protein